MDSLTPKQIQMVARKAFLDARTVRKALAGGSHSTTTLRVREACEQLGIDFAVRKPEMEARP